MIPVPLSSLCLVAAGGGLGAAARFAAVHWTNAALPAARLPWGTFAVNVLGSFLIGCILMWTVDHASTSPARLLLTTGFLGGFTTFSAFSFELTEMMAERRFGAAAAYSAGSVVLCVGACALGAALTAALTRGAAR